MSYFNHLKTIQPYEITVHAVLNLVRNWNCKTKFFISSSIVRQFDDINKNRLKNIFSIVLKENSIWLGALVLNEI